MDNKSTRSWLIAIALLSVALRVAVALYQGDTVPAGKDEYSYSELAGRLATGHGYSFGQGWYPFTPANAPTAHWSFLYTAFVAAVYAVAGHHPLAARLIQAVLAGLLMPWLTYRLARRMMGREGEGEILRLRTPGRCPAPPLRMPGREGEGERPAANIQQPVSIPLLAALLSSVYAYFVLYGAMVQTEAFFFCALLWSLERALALGGQGSGGRGQGTGGGGRMANGGWRMAILLGLSLGVATLLRQSILPWVVVLFAWLAWNGARTGKRWARRMLASLFVGGAVMLACIAPFTIRNYLAYDNFLLLNSNAGYAMYAAQHPMHGTSFQEYAAAPLPEDIDPATMNEATWDKALMHRGIGFVLAEPGRYLLLCLSRVRDYVEFWPTADSSLLFNAGRVGSIGVFLPFMLYGVWLEAKAKVKAKVKVKAEEGCFSTSALTLTLGFVLFYSALHIATWAMSRYRLPVDAVLLVFAAAGIADLWSRATKRATTRLRPGQAEGGGGL